MKRAIKAIAPWFGAKRIQAPEIVRQLGPHRCYWEPFCGAMSVLLAKPVASHETVNDLHGDLLNLARVLAHEAWGPWLYRKLRRALVHEDLFRRSAAVLRAHEAGPRRSDDADEDADITAAQAERAMHFFYAAWVGRSGVSGTRASNSHLCPQWSADHGTPGTRFASAVDSIPAWRRRLRRVTMLCRDGLELLEKIEDQPGVAIYCDPPYLHQTRNAANARPQCSGGSGRYVHDFAPDDHPTLAARLGRFRRARVVVSYYDHPRLDALYPGWTKLDCRRASCMSAEGARGGTSAPAPEVLLVNGPAAGSGGWPRRKRHG